MRLRPRLNASARLLLRELSAFGVVGAVCFVLDLALFQLLYATAVLGAVTEKLLASGVSTSAAFVGHRFWSFSRRSRSGLRREYALFFAVNGLALAVGMLMIAAVRYGLDQSSASVLQLTNIASIAVGTTMRFLLYRRWVFLAPAGWARDDGSAPAPAVRGSATGAAPTLAAP